MKTNQPLLSRLRAGECTNKYKVSQINEPASARPAFRQAGLRTGEFTNKRNSRCALSACA